MPKRESPGYTADQVAQYMADLKQVAAAYIQESGGAEVFAQGTTAFNGLIKYLRIGYIAARPLDLDNISMLYQIWDFYTYLCYKFNKYPIMQEFSILTGISTNTFRQWKNKETRAYIYSYEGKEVRNIYDFSRKFHIPINKIDRVASSLYSEFITNCQTECENALLRGAAEQNRIGSIFVLKAVYGYRENTPTEAADGVQAIAAAEDLPTLSTSGNDMAITGKDMDVLTAGNLNQLSDNSSNDG